MHVNVGVLVMLGTITYYYGKHQPNEMPDTLPDTQTALDLGQKW